MDWPLKGVHYDCYYQNVEFIFSIIAADSTRLKLQGYNGEGRERRRATAMQGNNAKGLQRCRATTMQDTWQT